MPLLRQKISGEGRSHASYSVNYPDRNMAFKVFFTFCIYFTEPIRAKNLTPAIFVEHRILQGIEKLKFQII